MTDYNLRIKLLRTKSAFMSLLEERELVIVDDNGIGQASTDSSLKVYDPDKTDIKQLYKTMKKPTKFTIEQPQTIQEGTTYFDKTDYTLKRYNGTDWEMIGRTINLDNNLDGAWTRCINIPILTPPSEDIQYKIEINGDNILVYSNDGTTVLTSGNEGLDFWSNVQSDGKDIRICDENYKQNYFWIEEFDYTNKKTVIWVRLNTSQSELNIAYNNNNCLISSYCNGNVTFEFFDDFSDGSLDGWTILNGGGTGTAYVVQYDGKYMAKLVPANVYNRVAMVHPVTTSNSGYILETRAITDATVSDGFLLAFSDGTIWSADGDDPQNGYMYDFARGLNSQTRIRRILNKTVTTLTYTTDNFKSNTYYTVGGSWYGNTLKLFENYNERLSATDSTFSNHNYIHLSCAINHWYFDWVRVRKYSPSNLSFDIPTVKVL